MPAIFSVAGTKVYIGGVIAYRNTNFGPADFNGQSWVQISWVESLGLIGDEAQELTSVLLNSDNIRKLRGYVDAGTMMLVAGRDYADAGQEILKTAVRLPYDYAFKLVFPDAVEVRYFIAKVLAFREQLDTVNNVIRANVALSINSNVTTAIVGATVPASGVLRLVGSAPTLTITQSTVTITPTVGALSLTGSIPRVLALSIQPPSGALSMVGVAPLTPFKPVPPTGLLALAPNTPNRGVTLLVTPGVRALSLTGNAPIITIELRLATPAVASLTLTGAAPVLSYSQTNISPATRTLLLTGVAPIVNVSSQFPSLREDGSFELREDGSFCLEEA